MKSRMLGYSKASVRVDQDLGVSFNTLVELVISSFGIVDRNLVADHKAWFGLTRNNQVSKVAIVLFHVALTCGKGQTLSCY